MHVAHTFRHTRGANFSSISFFEHPVSSQVGGIAPLIVAGDVDGFLLVFNLRSLRLISLVNVRQCEAAVLSSGSSTVSASQSMSLLFDKLEAPKMPQGVLAAEIVWCASAKRHVLWAQSRTMNVTLFDASQLMGIASTESDEEENDDFDEEDDGDDNENECNASPVNTMKLTPLVTLSGARNFSFAPVVCHLLSGTTASASTDSKIFFFCPHEANIIVNYETGERGTSPAIQAYCVQVNQRIIEKQQSLKGAAVVVDMCFDDATCLGPALGQIMNLNMEHFSSSSSSSSSSSTALLAVGSEAGYVVVMQVDFDAFLSPFAAAQRGSAPFKLLLRTRVAVDPVMSLRITEGRVNNNTANASSSSSSSPLEGIVVICGTAEGTLCTLAFAAAGTAAAIAHADGSSPQQQQKHQQQQQQKQQSLWSAQLPAGIGHLVGIRYANTVLAFLWNGDILPMKFDGVSDDDSAASHSAKLVPLPKRNDKASSSSSSMKFASLFLVSSATATAVSGCASSNNNSQMSVMAVKVHNQQQQQRKSAVRSAVQSLLSPAAKKSIDASASAAFAASDKNGNLIVGILCAV